jgi:hypothetical protein
MPNECVRRVLELPGGCVAGYHDLIAQGRLSDERCIRLAKARLRWTYDVLEDDVRAQRALDRRPAAAQPQRAGGPVDRQGSPEHQPFNEAQCRATTADAQRLISRHGRPRRGREPYGR